MGAFSIWHLGIVMAVVLIFFGKGRVSALMGDVGRGLGTFRRELSTGQRARQLPQDADNESRNEN